MMVMSKELPFDLARPTSCPSWPSLKPLRCDSAQARAQAQVPSPSRPFGPAGLARGDAGANAARQMSLFSANLASTFAGSSASGRPPAPRAHSIMPLELLASAGRVPAERESHSDCGANWAAKSLGRTHSSGVESSRVERALSARQPADMNPSQAGRLRRPECVWPAG